MSRNIIIWTLLALVYPGCGEAPRNSNGDDETPVIGADTVVSPFFRKHLYYLSGDDQRTVDSVASFPAVGTYEQITDLSPVLKAEFIFPLGQSGHFEGSIAGVTLIDPNATSFQPIWRDWRFVPMLRVSEDLEAGGNPDGDGDGVFDAFERWYFGDTSRNANDDSDGDKTKLIDEFLAGTDPTDADTDDDGIPDGRDTLGQDRLRSGYLKLKGKIIPTTDGRLIILGKIGTGSPEFDPNTKKTYTTERLYDAIALA